MIHTDELVIRQKFGFTFELNLEDVERSFGPLTREAPFEAASLTAMIHAREPVIRQKFGFIFELNSHRR